MIGLLLLGAAALAAPIGWPALATIGGVILAVVGLGIGVLDTPILRAVSLGAIQGLYALLGGLSAGPRVPGSASRHCSCSSP